MRKSISRLRVLKTAVQTGENGRPQKVARVNETTSNLTKQTLNSEKIETYHFIQSSFRCLKGYFDSLATIF